MFCVHFPAFKNADFEDEIVEASFLGNRTYLFGMVDWFDTGLLDFSIWQNYTYFTSHVW